MKRHRVILQLESELVQASAASADRPPPYDANEDPAFYEGYWTGRIFGLQSALSCLKEKA
tara:strand:- start:1089 stop:1268 length:180 start_codon:yes stop_codon:yes gene_type:complete